MATHHLPHHESHGNHPMSVLGYLLVLGGFASAALWLVAMAGGNVVPAIVFGLLMIGAFAGATWTVARQSPGGVPGGTCAVSQTSFN